MAIFRDGIIAPFPVQANFGKLFFTESLSTSDVGGLGGVNVNGGAWVDPRLRGWFKAWV